MRIRTGIFKVGIMLYLHARLHGIRIYASQKKYCMQKRYLNLIRILNYNRNRKSVLYPFCRSHLIV